MKGALGRLAQFFIDLPLRSKLMAFFASALALSSLLFYAVAYAVVSAEYRDQIQYSAELSFSQAYDYMQKMIEPLLYASEIISLNDDVQEILAANSSISDQNRSLPQQYRDMLRLTAAIQSAANPGEIERICIYLRGKPMYVGTNSLFDDFASLNGQSDFISPSRQFYWKAPEDALLARNEPPVQMVSLVRKIRDPNRFNNITGAVSVSIRADALDGIIYRSNITTEGLVYVTNDDNEVICASDQTRLQNWRSGAGTGFLPETSNAKPDPAPYSAPNSETDPPVNAANAAETDPPSNAANAANSAGNAANAGKNAANSAENAASAAGNAANAAENAGWEQVRRGGEVFLTKSLPVQNTNWRMTALIPLKEIDAPAVKMGVLMLIAMLIIIIVASISAFAFFDWFTGRLRKLAKQMVSVRSGSLDVEIRSADNDEVGMLYDSFDYMARELKQYVKRQYENGKEIKSAELRALQAQINPHFLYNTLDLINWVAMNHRVPEIVEITNSLARFYKLGLSNGREIVTVEDELEHVREYVNIQNHRFENRIELKIDASEDVRRMPIQKIILQPFVENAILHGLMARSDHDERLLEIRAWRDGGVLFLTVRDNGAGMTEEQLSALAPSAGDRTEGEHGYGARNVQARIRLYYGEEYGVTFSSSPGAGTTVTVYIPAPPPTRSFNTT